MEGLSSCEQVLSITPKNVAVFRDDVVRPRSRHADHLGLCCPVLTTYAGDLPFSQWLEWMTHSACTAVFLYGHVWDLVEIGQGRA